MGRPLILNEIAGDKDGKAENPRRLVNLAALFTAAGCLPSLTGAPCR